ncbi:MAG: hypothetical protein KR126chlam6_00214 [Candidatus Anoxychlamydiales bacterium]|nr:hypothetical protein [Candidatus Anoxychlamydiales bacterium]
MQKLDDIFFEDLHDTDAIFVYGTANDKFYSFLKDWLLDKKDRKLYFLEDNKEQFSSYEKHINQLFQTKANILFIEDIEKDLKKIAWDFVYLNIKCVKSSKETRFDNFSKIASFLENFHLGANLTSYLYSDFGINIFENVYNNLLKTDELFLFENFKDKFKNRPAVIVGAGPTLEKNAHFLKEFYDKALIFAGGSALNILSNKNIRFHFGSSVDQKPYFKRFKQNNIFEKPFFYQNQINHNNFSLVNGKKILLSDYGLYPLKRWIYEKLNLKQETIEAGWTVTTFLIKIAKFLGCDPIITVGLDLSFKNNKYAKGAVKTKDNYKQIKTKDINNLDVYTQKDWILAKNWIEEFAKSNKDTTFINATEGGLKIENLKNLKLLDVLNDFEKDSLDFDGLIHSIFTNQSSKKIDKTKVLDILAIIKTSYQSSDVICDEYLKDIEKNIFDFDLIKLKNEIVYTHLLEPMWQIWKHVILRQVEKHEVHILINKLLFFKNVIFEHLNLLGKIL